jgi:hypothetical protein
MKLFQIIFVFICIVVGIVNFILSKHNPSDNATEFVVLVINCIMIIFSLFYIFIILKNRS